MVDRSALLGLALVKAGSVKNIHVRTKGSYLMAVKLKKIRN